MTGLNWFISMQMINKNTIMKNTLLTVRIDQETKDHLQSISDLKICHLSDLIREGIDMVINRENGYKTAKQRQNNGRKNR